jgi:hypothetical protein
MRPRGETKIQWCLNTPGAVVYQQGLYDMSENVRKIKNKKEERNARTMRSGGRAVCGGVRGGLLRGHVTSGPCCGSA